VHWGYEDTELFYRVFTLHGRRGDVFELDDDAVCYHLPHFHAWHANVAHAGSNLGHVFRKHPTYDFEPLLAGLSPLYAIRAVTQFEEALDLCRKHGLGRVDRLPAGVVNGNCLLFGFGTADMPLPEATVTVDHDRPPDATNPHLAGLRTPFPDAGFDRVVSVDLWRFFGPDMFSLLLLEALRVAGEVELVLTEPGIPAATMLPVPFIDDIDYVAQLVGSHFDVDVRRHAGGAASLIVCPRRTA
jgi:hypothetical protein